MFPNEDHKMTDDEIIVIVSRIDRIYIKLGLSKRHQMFIRQRSFLERDGVEKLVKSHFRVLHETTTLDKHYFSGAAFC